MSANLEAGDLVSIIPLPPISPLDHCGATQDMVIPVAARVSLLPTTTQRDTWKKEKSKCRSIRPWEGFAREVLLDQKYIALDHYLAVPRLGSDELLRVTSVGGQQRGNSETTTTNLELFLVTRDTVVTITEPIVPSAKPPAASGGGGKGAELLTGRAGAADAYDGIGGLDKQIEQLRELVELPLTRPELYTHFNLTPPRGVLLYGPSGTGKSLLASAIARGTSSSLLTLSSASISSAYHGETERALLDLFSEAKRKSPCVVVIDEIDGLCPRREDGGEVDRRVVGAMLVALDSLGEPDVEGDPAPRVVVVACTNRPQGLDPALRRPGRFDKEIEVGTPNSRGRAEILGCLLRKTPHELGSEDVEAVAGKTHGFVGADLRALLHAAGLHAIKRAAPSLLHAEGLDQLRLTSADLDAGLLVTRPSAMREVHVETPKVSFSDIGGMATVKQRLKESVEWPLSHPQTFARLGIRPPRGVLLYGPPGCSKTLTAKALASEGGLNFLSVKGSEVFSKYVGESEKAIREVFGKARAAAPSIVFLDEVDAIAMSRGSEGEGGHGTGDRVLTSLLTEMDGIEELNGVLVLAATNRPDVIDSALMRPGRLDRILYVGPPDYEARIEIFKIQFCKMAVASDVDPAELASLTDGCTGAEVVAVCQDAAMKAMLEDLDAPHVERRHFLEATKTVRRRVTPDVVKAYEDWRDSSGVQNA